MSIRNVLLGAVLVLPALAACQTKSVSLEEAKQITATFEGSAFTPPPRTIRDITAILDDQKLVDPAAAEKARAEASIEPPSGLDDLALVKFYWERGMAAVVIGAVKQQIADLTLADRLAEASDSSARVDIIWKLCIAEAFAGNHADSLRHCKQAIDLVPQDRQGALISRRSLLARFYASAGDFEASDRLLAEAESIFNQATSWRSWSRWGSNWTSTIRRTQARILFQKGKYAEAEPVFRAALRATEEMSKSPYSREYAGVVGELILSDLARNLTRQGRLVEAEIEARKALTSSLQRLGRYSSETAHTLKRLASVLGAQGRYQESGQLARAVLDIIERTGAAEDSTYIAVAHLQLATNFVSQGMWAEALGEFDALKKGLATDPASYERFFAGNANLALALAGAGRAAEAKPVAEAALQRSLKRVGEKHSQTAAARGVLALSLAELNEREAALNAFSKAVPILLSRSRQSDDEASTQGANEQRLSVILESYIGVLAAVRGTDLETKAGINAAAEAFRIADVARSRSVQRALAASSARAAAREPALADLVRREQDTQKQVAALFGLLAEVQSAPTDQQDPKAVLALRTRIDQLRDARAALAQEIEAKFPEYAELINPKPVTIEDARATLAPGEALISTYVGRDRSYVWAVPKQGSVAFAAMDMGREDLADQVALLRGALEPAAVTLGDIPAFDLAAAHELYAKLLAPVKAGWGEAKSLLIVAHGPLGYLPMSILPTETVALGAEREPLFANYRDVPWLARTHAVTMLPSVASLKTLRGLPPGDAKRLAFAGFGDPWFSAEQAAAAAKPKAKPVQVAALTSRGIKTRGLSLRAAPKTTGMDSAELARLPRLPDTADEVKSIAVALKANLTDSVFLGRDANEGQIKSLDLSGYKVLAFATHGLVPGDLNGLTQPALALSSPKVSGGTDDGLLTMGEILGLKLNADWVVLSACNTGSGQGAGAEAVSGLGRAFFYAGTRALLVSNWPVETTSAKALTTDLFKRQADDPALTRAQALRQAMVGLIDDQAFVDEASGKTVFSYAHPIFWAPFSLVGDGGGGGKS